jgi:twinkle protein
MMMFEETVRRTMLGLMGITLNKNLALLNQPEKEEGFASAFENTNQGGRLVLYDHFGSTGFDNVLDRIRYMASGCGCEYVVLDHLSILVSGMADGDERRLIDNAMTALKTVSMECNIGLILVSHLRRPSGDKGHEEGASTSLSQLRGSHAIAQLSDIVIGLERDQQDASLADITTLRVLKNRWTGETGLAGWLHYNRETGRLRELLDDPRQDGNTGTRQFEGGDPYF